MASFVGETVVCPNCRHHAIQQTWDGDCECDNCGHEWNQKRARKAELRRKREAWDRRHSGDPGQQGRQT